MTAPHITRHVGTAHLRDWHEQAAALPDPSRAPDLACPRCGVAVTVRASKHRPSWIVWHPPGTCPFGETFGHYPGVTREQAMREWREGCL